MASGCLGGATSQGLFDELGGAVRTFGLWCVSHMQMMDRPTPLSHQAPHHGLGEDQSPDKMSDLGGGCTVQHQ